MTHIKAGLVLSLVLTLGLWLSPAAQADHHEGKAGAKAGAKGGAKKDAKAAAKKDPAADKSWRKGPDPIEVGPTVYKTIFENERVRVNEVTFKPKAKIASHWHPDHVVYVISGGKLKITGEDGKEQVMDLKKGMTAMLPTGSHSAVHAGGGTIKVVQVELKK